jgi:hypothetical protein
MLDTKHIYDVSLQILSIASILGLIGYCVGAMSGFLFKYVNRQMMCVIMLAFVGLARVSMPHLPGIVYYCVACFLLGIGSGCWDMSMCSLDR